MRRKTAIGLIFLVLGGCGGGPGSIEDHYGNSYGDFYNPGRDFAWQIRTCEQEMESYNIPLTTRPYAMQCCMWLHGVAMDEPPQCR